jgi:hypothetical protein
LKNLLQHDADTRITWDNFFEHPWLENIETISFESNIFSSIVQNNTPIVNGSISFDDNYFDECFFKMSLN